MSHMYSLLIPTTISQGNALLAHLDTVENGMLERYVICPQPQSYAVAGAEGPGLAALGPRLI